jgi:hypothetical protein
VPWAYGCTLGIRRDAFARVGGFDPEILQAGEDVDLCWRLHDAGCELHFVPEAVVHYRFPTTMRALYRQGRTYGAAAIAVDRRHDVPVHQASPLAWLRPTLGALRLIALGGSRGRRARGVFLLGRRMGLLEGNARRRLGLSAYR